MATVIRPFSFREFLRHRGEEPTTEPRRWTPAERSLIEKRFREYLLEGGFPEAQGVPAALRIELLQSYVDTVHFRDVVDASGRSRPVVSRDTHARAAGPDRGGEGSSARDTAAVDARPRRGPAR
ncbi:MAG: hypothetical protein WED01_02650 [Candidatus Rokuibacteriota bacterium]